MTQQSVFKRTAKTYLPGLLLSVVAALAISAAGSGAQESSNPSGADSSGELKVAYVDFAQLVDNDYPMKRELARLQLTMDMLTRDLNKRLLPLIEEQKMKRSSSEPDSPAHFEARTEGKKLETKYYRELQGYQVSHLGSKLDVVKQSFVDMKARVDKVAKSKGYTLVLNVAHSRGDKDQDGSDIDVLRKELALSPVLVYDKEHDLTGELLKELKTEIPEISEVYAVDAAGKEVEKLPPEEGKEDSPEYLVALGQTLQLTATLKQAGVDRPLETDESFWQVLGFENGEITEQGQFTAPAKMPRIETVRIRVQYRDDPQAKGEIRLKLVKE